MNERWQAECGKEQVFAAFMIDANAMDMAAYVARNGIFRPAPFFKVAAYNSSFREGVGKPSYGLPSIITPMAVLLQCNPAGVLHQPECLRDRQASIRVHSK